MRGDTAGAGGSTFDGRARETCPRCGPGDTRYVMIGLPSDEAVHTAPPWVGFGGCLIPMFPEPDWSCEACHHAWFGDAPGPDAVLASDGGSPW